MKFKDSFHPYAMITILFWSMAYVFTRLSLQYFSASSLGFLRYFVASCTLILFVIFMKIKRPKKEDCKWFLLAGALGFFLYMITLNRGCETISASTSSVIIATAPVSTALLARFIYSEKLAGYKWLAIAIEFFGVIVLTIMSGGLEVNVGIIWLFVASLLLSSYNLLQRKLTKTYSALQTSAYSIFVGTLMLAIFLPVSIQEVQTAPPITLLYLIILGVFSSAIAYIAWAKAFAKAEQTSSVSNYMFITPFLTSILGFFIANEIPDLSTIVGGSIILIGLLFFNFGDKFFSKGTSAKTS